MTTNAEQFLGPFRGSDLTASQLDGILAYAFNKGDVETGRSMMASKWWDYRFIHPGQAYMIFAHHYAQAVERWRTMFAVPLQAKLRATENPIWREEIVCKKNKAGKLTNIIESRRTVMAPAVFRTGLWRAMCFADSLGVPYQRYIGLAFEYAHEAKWERMPQPSALYGAEMVRSITETFRAEEEAIFYLPKDPRYLAENFNSHPWQIEFQGWLMDLISKRPIPLLPLSQCLAKERFLVPELAVRRFGVPLVQEAIQRARTH